MNNEEIKVKILNCAAAVKVGILKGPVRGWVEVALANGLLGEKIEPRACPKNMAVLRALGTQ